MSTPHPPLNDATVPSRLSTPAHAFGKHLAPEFELLFHCAQPSFNYVACARVNHLLRQKFDWLKLTQLAMNHGLSPIVYTRLEQCLPRHLLDPLLNLKTDAAHWIQLALVHTGEMKRLVPSLQANGIQVVVLKGPALSQSLYGRIALRVFMDLDFWVQPEDVARAWSLLTAEGYTLSYKVSSEQLPQLIKAGNHLPFYGVNNECIELHWTLFPKTRATFFDTAGAWSRRVPLTIQNRSVMTLAPRDLIHFLCLHGIKHMWSRLSWLADLAWFIHRYPDFDWALFLDEAYQNGTRRMVLVSLALTHELFASPLDESVSEHIRTDRQVLPLAKWMWERILAGNQDLPTGRELVQLVMRTRERSRDRGRDLYYHLMALRPNNLEDVPRYGRTSVGYGIHRLWYLARKYGHVRN